MIVFHDFTCAVRQKKGSRASFEHKFKKFDIAGTPYFFISVVLQLSHPIHNDHFIPGGLALGWMTIPGRCGSSMTTKLGKPLDHSAL